MQKVKRFCVSSNSRARGESAARASAYSPAQYAPASRGGAADGEVGGASPAPSARLVPAARRSTTSTTTGAVLTGSASSTFDGPRVPAPQAPVGGRRRPRAAGARPRRSTRVETRAGRTPFPGAAGRRPRGRARRSSAGRAARGASAPPGQLRGERVHEPHAGLEVRGDPLVDAVGAPRVRLGERDGVEAVARDASLAQEARVRGAELHRRHDGEARVETPYHRADLGHAGPVH